MNGTTGFDEGFGSDGTEGLLLPPWERRERFGFLNALYLTTKDALISPGRFFHQMPSNVGLTQPLLYAVVIGVIASFFAWMWSFAGSSLKIFLADNLSDAFQGPLISFGFFIFSPILVAISLFIEAILMHLMLLILGGNKLGFEATFRVSAYSSAATIVTLVPICGSLVAVFWSLIVTVVGLYRIHDIEPWKAIVAVLAPVLLTCFLVGSVAFTLGLLAG